MSDKTKPTVLVLGGLGFIGRNFVTYLIENDLASEIRVVDKVLLITTALNVRQKAAFSKVDVKQKDLADPVSISAVHEREDGSSYDYVFNLAAETKYSQNEKVYEERILGLSVRNAKEAAKRKVKVFVEVSTAEIYQSDKNPSKEDEKIKPWNVPAKYKYKAEEGLKNIENLNLVILRPAMVYGLGATSGLAPRLVCGRIYKYIKEEMKFLWTKDLKINTVHVTDVCRALWHIAKWYESNNKAGKGPVIYNLADKGNTDQERINKRIGSVFNIPTGFFGTLTSNFTQLNLDNAVEDINEKHMRPWAMLLRKNRIKNTPLSPYLDKELLYNNALCVDGSKIEETGFEYEVPQVTDEKLKEMVDDFIALGLWPVNPSILGDFMIELGEDKTIDLSVAFRIAKLNKLLTEVSNTKNVKNIKKNRVKKKERVILETKNKRGNSDKVDEVGNINKNNILGFEVRVFYFVGTEERRFTLFCRIM
ncbi:2104_t:CDS:10 [Diversispora eburnea]|uniref:2104_t:CDS:1 n=1 Tax=Diversispora eburnea TaxID=1213867 RepID=A0A9N9FLI4_9GLOM|nr:2104_t:CDS:10 [Diversispora eburnea]